MSALLLEISRLLLTPGLIVGPSHFIYIKFLYTDFDCYIGAICAGKNTMLYTSELSGKSLHKNMPEQMISRRVFESLGNN